ncbi:Alpha/beta-Hydrolases superfamily protein [Rhynchospora pubera]|uniref:Phospholipase A1 n=1 Tax=Rhynchospora pubera TaxID=906938 RepID=A0AAV8FCK8_9POAL|nr:Alpha/beta-Hydrolases superfamily protein [Rhynchospora pubera]
MLSTCCVPLNHESSNRNGYTVTTFLYAMSRLNMPHWLEKSFHPKAWNHDSNWMGYVAVSGDAETERIGCRDVLVTWRGTIAPTEWLKDMDVRLEHFGGKNSDAKVIRVVVRHDIVPHLPGIPFNKKLEKVENLAESWHGLYTHYGYELNLEVKSSPYLKQMFDLVGYHNLEMYLHLVDGHISSNGSANFREDAKRDVALVNKWSGMLKKETLVPSCWYQPAFKGLVCNKFGRWVIPEREPEDVPPPPGTHVPLSVFN